MVVGLSVTSIPLLLSNNTPLEVPSGKQKRQQTAHTYNQQGGQWVAHMELAQTAWKVMGMLLLVFVSPPSGPATISRETHMQLLRLHYPASLLCHLALSGVHRQE
jgi:hypothetical protein